MFERFPDIRVENQRIAEVWGLTNMGEFFGEKRKGRATLLTGNDSSINRLIHKGGFLMLKNKN